jgi:predicted metal-dependent peptidase
MSELLGILDTFQDYRIHLFCFDTAIYEYLEITPNNVDEVADYIPRGRGGTDFVCIFDFIADMMDIPDRLVVFTDGKPNGSWGDPHLIETLWVIYDNPQAKPPFGQATFMK